MSEPIGRLSDDALVWIGVDYGPKQSVAVVIERNADSSWTVLDEVIGKGLDEVSGRTPAEQKSGGQPSGESGGQRSAEMDRPKT